MAESPTGRGYTQGSDSYNAYDMERIGREEARMKTPPVAEPKFEGDPNFGDYNIPMTTNTLDEIARKNEVMRKALEMVRTYMKEEVDEIGVELLTPENRAIWDAVGNALNS